MLTFELKSRIIVKLAKKIVGEIKTVKGGYQYFPKGSKTGGEVYKSLDSCMKSLES